MSRKLDDLTPEFRPLAILLLARLCEAGIPVMIVDTLRTHEEHVENLRKGTSWTATSKHLDGRQYRGISSKGSDAIDVAPYLQFQLYGPDKLQWDASDPVWQKMGPIGESIGLLWGGRWKKPDLGHFERRT